MPSDQLPLLNREPTPFSQDPVGFSVPDWEPPPRPPRRPLDGRYCRLEPLDADRHAGPLYEANGIDPTQRAWTYLPIGPFDSLAAYASWVRAAAASADPLFFAIVDHASGLPTGVAAYLRITPEGGTIEIGHLNFSPRLQRTRAATEALYLLMRQAFTLGYRRCEWKCDSLNAPSRVAAQRLGFSFEGVFRQATVYKGRNRDTAWYAIIDAEWAALEAAYGRWLDPANFDGLDRQRARLSELTAPILVARG